VKRDQQKYQIRYDVAGSAGTHSPKFGVNFIHEPVMGGALATDSELLVQFPHDPSFYVANPGQFAQDFAAGSTLTPASDVGFAQNVQRLGLYAQDSWRVTPNLTINYGLRYDTTFGLFQAEGRDQNQNPAVATVNALGLPLTEGIPHDYRKAIAPRLSLAYSPGRSGRSVIRAGVGLYYNDLTQNGWVDAFRAVDRLFNGTLLGPGDQGAMIDPNYKTPYALQASFGFEHRFKEAWRFDIQYEHQQGVHQYRRYEYIGGVTLPGDAPNISVFKTDNRSRYDGVAIQVQHRLSNRFELSASYTLASATTWGATVGELFDYVNGVTDVRNAFGPGDHGPSGEDVRHRVVIAGTVDLRYGFQLSTLSQFESARPFTMTTPVDINGDGLSSNDRAVVNGVQTSLDQFRGSPFYQVDLRVSKDFRFGERASVKAFVEFFNLFNRQNPGNNYVPDVSALSIVPPDELGNITHLCANSDCSSLVPITSPNQLKQPAGALGDFFGPGTTVGLPFAAQIGFRIHF
ncbi:MAG: TonB-dependent receptor domain-containing protein, partial [Blastocatellia bacterium]